MLDAQQPKKVHRIGYLSNTGPSAESDRAEAIRLALRERGYIEGQNIDIHYRYGEGNRERAPKLAAELVVLNCDVILVAGGVSWVRAAKNATRTIPIIMTGSGDDPVQAGLVESLARPGGNVTGITSLSRELGGKRLEILKEAVPKLSRVAVLYEKASPSSVIEVKEDLPVAAHALKLTLQPSEVRNANDFEKAFSAMNKQHADGLYVSGSGSLMNVYQKHIVDLALKRRLPSISSDRDFVEAGGLMSYGADQTERYQRVAYYVDRILKGTKATDLPVEQPMRFEFLVNLQTEKRIGITIDRNVLARATKIIR